MKDIFKDGSGKLIDKVTGNEFKGKLTKELDNGDKFEEFDVKGNKKKFEIVSTREIEGSKIIQSVEVVT